MKSIREICRASVGLGPPDSGAVVWRGPGGSTLTRGKPAEEPTEEGTKARPSIEQQRLAPGIHPVTTPGLRQQIRQGMGIGRQAAGPVRGKPAGQLKANLLDQRVSRIEEGVEVLKHKTNLVLDRLNREPPRAARSAPAPDTFRGAIEESAARDLAGLEQRSYRLPLPETGNSPGYTVTITNTPDTPAGMANAAVCDQQSGPMPGHPLGNVKRPQGALSVAEAVRRGLGRGVY